MFTRSFPIALLLTTSSIMGFAAPINDDFSDPKLEGRAAQRGDWKFSDKTASCIADEALYKKYANHGPIIRWASEFVDGTIEFEMKSTKGQRVIFTLNGDGHVFRVLLCNDADSVSKGAPKVASRILAWAEKSSKKNQGDTFKPEGLPSLAAVDDKWVKVSLSVNKGKANLAIGDFKTEIEHASLARDKNSITLSFAFGEFAVRSFKFTEAAG
jgi:hypothetical protein